MDKKTEQQGKAEGQERTRAVFSPSKEGIVIHLTGPMANKAYVPLLQSCVNSLADCTQQCANLSDPIQVFQQSFVAIAGHNIETGCFSRGFGLIPSEGIKPIEELESGYARVNQVPEGIEIHITGPIAEMIDVKLLQSCVNTAFACTEANNCISERGLLFSDACINTLLPQTLRTSCVSSMFGLLPLEQRLKPS